MNFKSLGAHPVRLSHSRAKTRKSNEITGKQNSKGKNTEDQKSENLIRYQVLEKNAGFRHRFSKTMNYNPTGKYRKTELYIEGGNRNKTQVKPTR